MSDTSNYPTDPANSQAQTAPAADPASSSAPVADPAASSAAPPVDTPAAGPAEDTPKAGQLVRHAWEDPTGDHEAFGLVVNVLHDEGAPDRVEVLWFRGKSGPIPASDLEVVEHD